jgi:hypothetical protein
LERQNKNYRLWQVTGRKHHRRKKVKCKFTASCDLSGFCHAVIQSFSYPVLGYFYFLLISACLVLHFILYFEGPLLSVRTVNNITCIYFPCASWWTCQLYRLLFVWDMTPCHVMKVDWHFRGLCHNRILQNVSALYKTTQCHIWEVTAVRNWNVGCSCLVGICWFSSWQRDIRGLVKVSAPPPPLPFFHFPVPSILLLRIVLLYYGI